MQISNKKERSFQKKGSCSGFFDALSPSELSVFFQSAGLERMHEKAERILPGLLKDGMGKTFLRVLFEASGAGGGTRKSFEELFERILIYDMDIFRKNTESVLWGESGLLPADSSGAEIDPDAAVAVRNLWRTWWPLRKKAMSAPIVWPRAGVRPQSSPERKIAFLCAFLKKNSTNPLPLFLEMLDKKTPENFTLELEKSFQESDPFWNSHSSFRTGKTSHPAVLSGPVRARTLLANTAFPALYALLTARKNEKGRKKLDSAYLFLAQTIPNVQERNFFNRAFSDPERIEKHLKNAAERQGALHFWKTCCEPASNDCGNCRLLKSLFPVCGRKRS